MHKVSSDIRIIKIILKERRNLWVKDVICILMGMAQTTDLHRTYVYTTVYQVISDFDLGVRSQDISRNVSNRGTRIPNHWLIVQAFRGFWIHNKYGSITPSSATPIANQISSIEKQTDMVTCFVGCFEPLSFTTIVIIASLFVFRRSLCILTTSSIRILLTRSPITRTKSLVTSPRV